MTVNILQVVCWAIFYRLGRLHGEWAYGYFDNELDKTMFWIGIVDGDCPIESKQGE